MVLTHVTIDLTNAVRTGERQFMTRCTDIDKGDIDEACRLLGLSLSDFVRTTVVLAAREIVARDRAVP